MLPRALARGSREATARLPQLGRERRQQLKWLLGGGAVCSVGLFGALTTGSNPTGIAAFLSAGGITAVVALPAGIGVGILKYRLYDIDRLISRTISYTIVTGLLVGVFSGLVLLATRALPLSSPVGVAAATLAAAALFNPLRRRTQWLVDRRFNPGRYDAEATVAAFSGRLRDAVDLDTIRATSCSRRPDGRSSPPTPSSGCEQTPAARSASQARFRYFCFSFACSDSTTPWIALAFGSVGSSRR